MKIFLSSTYEDLIAHRKAAAEAIERLRLQPVRMETFGAMPLEATSACREEISGSDTVIGLYAHRYGYTPKGESKSVTELEFDIAVEQDKPILCFVVSDEYPWPPKHVETEEPGRTRLREFLNRIREKFVEDKFEDPKDLAYKVACSLGRFLSKRNAKYELEKTPALRGARLLLVNDTPGEMSHVIEMLRDRGIDVQVTSSDGALSTVPNETYDLVVVDMKNDAESLKSIQEILKSVQERGIPVVLTAGHFNFDPTLPPPPTFNILFNILFGALKPRRDTSG